MLATFLTMSYGSASMTALKVKLIFGKSCGARFSNLCERRCTSADSWFTLNSILWFGKTELISPPNSCTNKSVPPPKRFILPRFRLTSRQTTQYFCEPIIPIAANKSNEQCSYLQDPWQRLCLPCYAFAHGGRSGHPGEA